MCNISRLWYKVILYWYMEAFDALRCLSLSSELIKNFITFMFNWSTACLFSSRLLATVSSTNSFLLTFWGGPSWSQSQPDAMSIGRYLCIFFFFSLMEFMLAFRVKYTIRNQHLQKQVNGNGLQKYNIKMCINQSWLILSWGEKL